MEPQQLNLSKSLQNTNQDPDFPQKVYCDKHPSEQLTNFCCVMDCLKALCPECIDTHNRVHRQNHVFPEIDSLKNVKKNCSKKVKAGINVLTQELEKLELKHFLNPQDLVEEGLETLRRARDRVLQLVEGFFEGLEADYKRSVSDISLQGRDMNGIFEKVRNFINELEFLVANLDSSNAVNTMKKICMMDLKSLIDKYRADIQSVGDQKSVKTVEVLINEPKLKYFEAELKKYVKFSQQAEREQTILSPSFRNSAKDQKIPDFNLNMDDFFDHKVTTKYLHFFPNEQKLLYLLDLETLREQPIFDVVQLSIPFIIPRFHKSLITSQGYIFLIGGTSVESGKKITDVYLYDYELKNLKTYGNLLLGRSSHSLCYHKASNSIFVIGGLMVNQEFTKSCERFDIMTGESKSIAKLNDAVGVCGVCSFNENYIFKFGGLSNGLQLNNSIERYDISKDVWEIIDARFDTHDAPKINLKEFGLLSTCCAIQINRNEIMVFGGYKANNEASNLTFLLSSETDERNIVDFDIKWINYKPLSTGEGFWNNQAILMYKKVFALQNINDSKNENCLENQRRVLSFNSNAWKCLN